MLNSCVSVVEVVENERYDTEAWKLKIFHNAIV